MILRSLPSSYDTLTTALESRSDADLTLELVAGVQGRSSKKKKPLICHRCKKEGHKQFECPQRARDSDGDPKPKRKQPPKKREDFVSFAFAAGACANSDGSKPWVVDSGATRHTVADRSFFSEPNSCDIKYVKLADGKLTKVEGQGCGTIECCDENRLPRQMNISVALYTPDLAMNLLSVPAIMQMLIFDARGCQITRDGTTMVVATLKHGLYQLKQPEEVALSVSGHHNKDCPHVRHRRFGHRDPAAIIRMKKNDLVSGLEMFDCGIDEPCDCCLKGKSFMKQPPGFRSDDNLVCRLKRCL
ncbi:uncharacterized protein LOC134289745 [Aedes albopictus]|uniref:CCHC-type domain-containing protein n=1 Tax=Aedes albopictus TaxID=7160 RepID=A0ABM1ZU63_AEDAL